MCPRLTHPRSVVKKKLDAAVGRPTDYCQDVGDDICTKLADGWSLVEICKAAHMPARSTVHGWLLKADLYQKADKKNEFTEFLDSYVRAREVQMDAAIDEILEIADNGMNDWELRENSRTGGSYVSLNAEAVARSKLRVEARFRLAERLYPKKYGQKMDLTSKGEVLKTTIVVATNADKDLLEKV